MLGPSNLPPMESAPLWQTLLLEKPLYGAAVLALAGGAAWWALTLHGRAKAALVALVAALGLAAGVMGLGSAVQTTREAAIARTQAFIGAVVEEDAGAVEALLAPNATFWAAGQGARGLDRAAFVNVVENLDGEIVSNAMSVQGASVDSGGTVTVRFRCATNVRYAGSANVRSVWEADWRAGASGELYLTRLDCMWISGVGADAWVGWALRFDR